MPGFQNQIVHHDADPKRLDLAFGLPSCGVAAGTNSVRATVDRLSFRQDRI